MAETNSDLLEDLLLPEEGEEEGILDPKELKKMQDELAAKDKQIAGLLNEVKTDRRKRQEYKGQLDAVTETVNAILTQREQAEQLLAEASSDGSGNIEVDITDDGDAFIPRDKLNEAVVAPLQQRIEELESMIQAQSQQASSARDAEQVISSIVGKDERYAPVYSKYQAARKWVNDKVIDFQQENNIQGQLSSGQALTHVFDDSLTEEFQNQFPEMDLAAVTTAEDSAWHFEQMLQKSADALSTPRQPDERFRQVVNKPSTLGKSSNAKAGELSLSDRVASLNATDIMDLSDSQVEALQKFMSDDEQKGGINF